MARLILCLSVFIALSSVITALSKIPSSDPSSTPRPDATKKSAKDAFEKYDLVTPFISTCPEENLDVVYVDEKGNDYTVNFGNQMEVYQTKQEPVVSWDAYTNALYTLIMFDADEPYPDQRHLRSPYLHWLVINIPDNSIEKGETAATYAFNLPAPGPSHRYTFVLYQQSGKVSKDLKEFLVRDKFSIVDFTSKQNMTGPVAGNFFKLRTLATPKAPTLKNNCQKCKKIGV